MCYYYFYKMEPKDKYWVPFMLARGAPFRHFFDPVLQELSWKIPWLTLAPFWLYFHCLRNLLGFILASKTVPFGTQICKAPANYRRHPP